MRFQLVIFIICLISIKIYGQEILPKTVIGQKGIEVSGIVKDSLGNPIHGSTIILKTAVDSIRGISNENGVFVFKNINTGTFVLVIRSIGYNTTIRKYFFDYHTKRIVLDPVILGLEITLLREVKINGAPDIRYKKDTVEYRASNYKVRENATVNELLKKMEGMEVNSDNTLVYQGQKVTKARLNGKDYAGGDIAQAIQNLPADIVEKIQIIDDYGAQAARTGIKNEDPKKVLNITTKLDRSVGNIINGNSGAGNNDRYDGRLLAQHINGNEQIGVIGKLQNTVNGVANNSNGTAGTVSISNNLTDNMAAPNAGTTQAGGIALNYRDEWGKHIQVNTNYNYSLSNVHAISSSEGEYFYSNLQGKSTQSTHFFRNIQGENKNEIHSIGMEFEFTPNNSSYLQIIPSLILTDNDLNNKSDYNQTGYNNQYSSGQSVLHKKIPVYGGQIFYQYIFHKPGRNISVQLDVNHTNQSQNDLQHTEIFYKDSLQNLLKDSLVNRSILKTDYVTSYKTSISYIEPLSKAARLEFVAQTTFHKHNNKTLTSNITDDTFFGVDSLSNEFSYNFIEQRYVLDYHYENQKISYTIGTAVNPSMLQKTNKSGQTKSTNSFFRILPVFRLQYTWSSEHNILLYYTGAQVEPQFYQIQAIPDYTDPQNPIFGNPYIKPALKHSINLAYNNYMPNVKLNLSANINAIFYRDQIVTNIVQTDLEGGYNTQNEIHFVNITGGRSILANYSIGKQVDSRQYTLLLNGFIFNDHALSMNNNARNVVTTWRFNERFGPRIQPNELFEVNPFVAYDISSSQNTLPDAVNTKVRTLSLNVDGRFYLLKSHNLTIGYSANKNFIKGISSDISNNPFVVNGFVEQTVFKKRNGSFKISIFDLLNQNHFVNRVITPNGYTDNSSNNLSRYLMLSFSMNLQKWNGVAKKNGKPMKRRGDGSFYE